MRPSFLKQNRMKKYTTAYNEIQSVEVEKESKHFFKVRDENFKYFKGGYKRLHDTFEDAKQHLLESNQYKIDLLKRDIKQLEEDRKRIESLTENDI